MATQVLKSFLPSIDEEAFAELLRTCLAECGYDLLKTVRHEDAAIYPALSSHLEAFPAGQAITWFRRRLRAGSASAIIIDQIPAVDGRWDLSLGRALSAAAGGFLTSMEARRARDEYGLATFFCGRPIEVLGRDQSHGLCLRGVPAPAPAMPSVLANEEAVFAAFSALFAEIADGSPQDLLWQGDIRPHSFLVTRRETAPPPYELAGTERTILSRAVVAHVEAETFQRALGELGPAAATLVDAAVTAHTAGVGIPYVLLERAGAFEPAGLDTIARRLDCHAFAVELAAVDRPFSWTEYEPGGGKRHGAEWGAAAFARRWADFSIVLGEKPGAFRWPRPAGPGASAPPYKNR